MPMPAEIIGLLRSKVTFKWTDGHETTYAARDLRLACRCASCIEETSGRPLLDPKTVPDTIRAKHIELVGQYAVSFEWTDGHTTQLPLPHVRGGAGGGTAAGRLSALTRRYLAVFSTWPSMAFRSPPFDFVNQ